jgi:lambda family phage portal protein
MSNRRRTATRGGIQAKGYSDAGASRTKRALKGFNANSGSPREDIDWNQYTLRQRGRALYMSAPMATSAININRTKIIGKGLSLKSTINREILGMSPEAAKKWQRKTEAEFNLWASKKENCDATGMNNFKAMQQLVVMSWLISGDVMAVVKRYDKRVNNPYSLRLHLIEADRVATPSDTISAYSPMRTDGKNKTTGNKIFDGIEVDANGMVVAYHIRSTYPNQITFEKTDWTRVEAYGKKSGLPNILHVMDSERCDQYRGITYLAQVIEPLLQLRRYTESELMGALIQSFFTAWITTSRADTGDIPINETGSGDIYGIPGDEPENISQSENEYEMGAGTVLHLEDGEDVKFGNPNIPTTAFENFVKTTAQLVGSALEIPRDVLVKEFNASYSASRAALLELWEAIKRRRDIVENGFCQPTYEIWLTEAVALGRIKAPGFFTDPMIRSAWCGAQWIGPVPGQLDPVKDGKAAIMAVDRGFKTHEQVTREQGGGDWEANVEQLALENEKLKNAGGGTYMAVLADEGGGTSGND